MSGLPLTSQRLPPLPTRTKPVASTDHILGRPEMLGPEFLHKCRAPSIRLKALESSGKRSTLFRHSHASNVLVILLSGQRVDVSCQTTLTTAGEVFEAVVAHTNLTEHYFFGLTHLRDGEHYFMEPEQKLHKVGPPGWKDQNKQNYGAKILFTLYLRLKYYPATLEFVRNDATIHQLYLQLRRDLIDERLRCSRDVAYSLAALALQAEYGDRPQQEEADYFVLEHYLPHRHKHEELGGDERIQRVLAEVHGQYAGLARHEAEVELLKMCQSLREYGIHFHRLFKSKPSHHLVPTPLGDPDTGVPMWIGIMPRGVIIFEEKASERIPISQHPWHLTQTLQFNRKKLVIVTKNDDANNNPSRGFKKLVYFADHYKKTSYFVHFAASQHRFCLKMKNWAMTMAANGNMGTLERVSNRQKIVSTEPELAHSRNSSAGDSGIYREPSPADAKGEVHFNTVNGAATGSGSVDLFRPNGKLTTVAEQRKGHSSSSSKSSTMQAGVADVSIPEFDRSLAVPDETISDSLAERVGMLSPTGPFGESDYDLLQVRLLKDSRFGLGLMLVDGEISGIRGVYVKSLNAGGPAELNGVLRVGDRLLSINSQSLDGLSRLDAVEIVRRADGLVEMDVARMRNMSNAFAASAMLNGNYPGSARAVTLPGTSAATHNAKKSQTIPAAAKVEAEPPKPPPRVGRKSLVTGMNDGEPPPESSASSRSSLSDHEAPRVQPPLPVLPAATSTPAVEERAKPPVIRAQGPTMYGGLHSSSDEESDVDEMIGKRTSKFLRTDQTPPGRSYELRAVGAMESDLSADEGEEFGKFNGGVKLEGKSNGARANGTAARGENLDWADELDLEDIQQIDLLDESELEVNNESTIGLSHQEVVAILKSALSPVTLGLARQKHMPESMRTKARQSGLDVSEVSQTQETIDVDLEKPPSGSLGLSLAKPTGPNAVGIFIKHISPGSVSDRDGRLRLGDRLWEVNGESVEDASPLEVVEKLKAAHGSVHLVVKREASSASLNS